MFLLLFSQSTLSRTSTASFLRQQALDRTGHERWSPLVDVILKYQLHVARTADQRSGAKRTDRLKAVCSVRNVHIRPISIKEKGKKTINTQYWEWWFCVTIILHILDRLFGGHMTAWIEGIRRRSRVHVEGGLNAHAQRHHRSLFHAHRTAP